MAENNSRNHRGLFLAFEGIDGCGKSTQIRRLAESLKAEGREVRMTQEPSDGPVGRLLRRILRGEETADGRALAPLFAADRLDHIWGENGIVRDLDRGAVVLTDRYYFSNYAYQSEELSLETVISMNEPAAKALRPDITFFLDIDPDTALDRIARGRDQLELFEKKDRLESARAHYFAAFRRLEREENIAVLDGSLPEGQLAEEILRLCRDLL